ncbi:hypothetical protein BH09BAC4_BH09BAC4_17400 [soil metagenome]
MAAVHFANQVRINQKTVQLLSLMVFRSTTFILLPDVSYKKVNFPFLLWLPFDNLSYVVCQAPATYVNECLKAGPLPHTR